MPIGVPKIFVPFPEDDDNDLFRSRDKDDIYWNDLHYTLFKQRIIMLGKKINSEAANQVAGMIVYLGSHNKKKEDINLIINSPGGDSVGGTLICDVMKSVEADVHTLCVGLAASVASLILATGTKTKRVAFPHAKIMMREPSSPRVDGPTGACIQAAHEMNVLRHDVIDMYAEVTGRPRWQISADLGRNFYLTPEEALEYGIIDEISTGVTEKRLNKFLMW